jgi:hypothetical protein
MPLTMPNPYYEMREPHDRETGVDIMRGDIALGLDYPFAAHLLQDVSLVPEKGTVIDITLPKEPDVTSIDRAGGSVGAIYRIPLPFVTLRGRPIPRLQPNTTYVVMLRVIDPDSPPKCAPIVWQSTLGKFTTGSRADHGDPQGSDNS